jgi:signal-transduction protein with cAMP-binding, CBS, and nucleotidyltransferase domain
MMDNIRQIIAEEDGIRAKAASKIKAAIRRNENQQGIEAMKSLLNKRIAERKVQDELKDVFETEQKIREQLSEQNAKTQAGSILKPKVKRTLDRKDYKTFIAGRVLGSKAKRAIYNQAFNAKIKDINDSKVLDTKIEKLIKTQTKNAFENFDDTSF